MKSLLFRVRNILIRPGQEWRVIRDEPATYGGIILRYVCVLAVIPPLAAVAGRIIFDRDIPHAALSLSAAYLVISNIVWYFMFLSNVVIAGAIITLIVTPSDSRMNGLQGLKISAYSFTPLFIAGSIAVFPKMGWVLNAAIAYSLYLLYLGIIAVASMGKRQALGYAVGSFLSVAVIVGFMNLFEYFLESFVMSRIMF